MNFRYENQGSNTYLVYQVESDSMIDTMSLGMLTNNKILGLAPAIFTQMDTIKFIKYDVSAKIPVKQFFSGPVNKKRLLGVFMGIANAMLAAEDYMLDVNNIILDLDYIFTDVSTCETVLICIPIAESAYANNDLGVFFKNIMFSTQFDQTENCDHVAKIINYLNSTPIFSLSDFKKVLDEINAVRINISTKQRTEVQQQEVLQKTQKEDISSVVQSKKIYKEEPKKQIVNKVQSENNIQTVPVQQPVDTYIPQQNEETNDGKKMSMFSLMMHYSKENAQLYKAQKAAKKNKGTSQAPQVPPNNPKKQANSQQANVSFNVPGKSGNAYGGPEMGFAIPGQASSPPAQSKPVSQSASAPKADPVLQPVNMQKQPVQTMQQPVQQTMTQPVQQQVVQSQGRPMNFGETMVLGSNTIGETTVLNAGVQKAEKVMPYLVRTKNNEKISVNKPVFRIGKERSYVDYFISDNTAISRSHANIISREGKYYITDTNSTNHTYINGKMIQSNDEVEIKHGTKFCLANEDFEFRLY